MMAPAGRPQGQGIQFRLATIFFSITLLAVALAFFTRMRPEMALFTLFFAAPMLVNIPPLFDRCLQPDRRGLAFGVFPAMYYSLTLGVYPVLMLWLATGVFVAEHRAHKGDHWFFYTLDQSAGYAIVPLYLIACFSIVKALCDRNYAEKSRLNLVMLSTCVLVEAYYALATLAFSFAGDLYGLALVPASICLCHLLLAYLIWHQAQFPPPWHSRFIAPLIAWVLGWTASIAAKYPLAWRIYEALPTEPPDHCFVVSAAARGHVGVVRSWVDGENGETLNQQLIVLRAFEARLQGRHPRLHEALRRLYNRVGPPMARCVCFRWQADLIYWALKPLEWTVRRVLRDAEGSAHEPS